MLSAFETQRDRDQTHAHKRDAPRFRHRVNVNINPELADDEIAIQVARADFVDDAHLHWMLEKNVL